MPPRIAVLLWVGVLGLLASPASAQATLRVVAHDDGAPGSHNERAQWFTIDGSGEGERGPMISLQAGSTATVTFANEGTRPHALNVSGWADSGLVSPNDAVTFALRVPADAKGGAYWCDLHRVLGMGGALDVGGVKGSFVAEATRGDLVPGAGVAATALALGVALALRRTRE